MRGGGEVVELKLRGMCQSHLTGHKTDQPSLAVYKATLQQNKSLI